LASTLWIYVNNPSMGTTDDVYPPGMYAFSGGETVTVKAIPYAGYFFVGWYLNDVYHPPTENPITFTMPDTGTVRLQANFSTSPPPAVLSIQPSTQTVKVGDQFTVNVHLDAGDYKIFAYQVVLCWNPNVIECVTKTATSYFQGIGVVQAEGSPNNVEGWLIASNSQTAGNYVTGSGDILTITFKAKAGGTSPIKFCTLTLDKTTWNTYLLDPDLKEVPLATADGQVTVGTAASLISVVAKDLKLGIQRKIYPEGEIAICTPGKSNLQISITLQNIGADGTLYVRLTDIDTGETFYGQSSVASGAQYTWTPTFDMPSDRPRRLTLEYGHLQDTTNVQDGTLSFTVYRAYILTISVNDPTMGTTNPPPGTYAAQEGATTVVGAFPSPGYELKNWTLDGQTVPKTDNSIAVTMDKDHALTANFGPVAAPPFDFTVEVNPTSATIKQGETATATVTVTLTSGTAQTVTLSASGLPADATATFNPQSGTPTFQSTLTITTAKTTPAGTYNITITGTGGGLTKTATFTLTVTQLPTYKLTIAVNDPKMGTTNPAPGEYTYPEGSSVTVQAIPNTGYMFVNWTLDGQTRTENPTTVTMDKDYTLTANFQPAPAGVTITGTVRGLFGRPVSGATVTLNGRTTTTDPSGKYTFTDLTPAVYRITVEHWLYETQSKAITATEPKTYTVDFQLSLKTPYLTAGLSTLAIIAGFITYKALFPKPKPAKGGKT